MQYHEWTEFISDDEFCIRACIGPRSKQLCNHIYDIMGCWWVSTISFFSFSSCFQTSRDGCSTHSSARRIYLPTTVLESTKSVSETLQRLWESMVPQHGLRESARRLPPTQLPPQAAARPCPPSVSLPSDEAWKLRRQFLLEGGILSLRSQGQPRCLWPRPFLGLVFVYPVACISLS